VSQALFRLGLPLRAVQLRHSHRVPARRQALTAATTTTGSSKEKESSLGDKSVGGLAQAVEGAAAVAGLAESLMNMFQNE